MATGSIFEIVDFVNRRTGELSKRVQGTHPTLGRVRKNFGGKDGLTRAQAWVNEHTPRQEANPPRPVITHLPELQVRRCEVAVAKLPPGTDIEQAVEFFRENHRPVTGLPMFGAAGAIEAFADWCRVQRKCQERPTIANRRIGLADFVRSQSVARSDLITVEKAEAWVYDSDVQTRSQRDRYDLLKLFCDFLVHPKRKYAAGNPMEQLDRPVHKVRVPGVLTFEETWRLLMCALTDAEGPDMLPFFVICVLSGVRPDEVPRLSRDELGQVITDAGGKPNPWADIHLDPEHRLIEVNKAKGGRRRRNVHISDPLWRILTWCRERGLAPNYFSRRKFDRIRKRAGLFARWEKDLLRHTRASHHYIVHKDIKTLEGDMGNSEDVLWQSYIRPVPLVDGLRMEGIILHYSSPREKSARGTGPKPGSGGRRAGAGMKRKAA